MMEYNIEFVKKYDKFQRFLTFTMPKLQSSTRPRHPGFSTNGRRHYVTFPSSTRPIEVPSSKGGLLYKVDRGLMFLFEVDN